MSIFKESAAEFKNIKSVVTAALLIALHTVFAVFVSIQVTESLRISISFIVNVVIGALYGPVMGIVCGAIGDIVQFVIKPTGPYFPGWTLNAALACFIYGIFFYKHFPAKKNAQDLPVTDKTTSNPFIRIARILLPLAAMNLMLWTPFVKVTGKGDNPLQFEGTGLSYIKEVFAGGLGSGIANMEIIAVLFMVMFVALFVLGFTKYNMVPLVISIFITFAGMLAVYTDRKTTKPLWGFVAVAVIMVIYIILTIAGMYKNGKIDIAFLIRTTLAITVDMLLVNILLGTYWVTVMYGKGFAFYFTTRFIKNIIQLPVNIILSYYVLAFIRDIRVKIGL